MECRRLKGLEGGSPADQAPAARQKQDLLVDRSRTGVPFEIRDRDPIHRATALAETERAAPLRRRGARPILEKKIVGVAAGHWGARLARPAAPTRHEGN